MSLLKLYVRMYVYVHIATHCTFSIDHTNYNIDLHSNDVHIYYVFIYSNSPPDTSGSHASGSEPNVTADNKQHDKVLYDAPAKTVTIPHQTSASGQEYAVSTKAANKTSQALLPSEQYDDIQGTKIDTQGVSNNYMYVCLYLDGTEVLTI